MRSSVIFTVAILAALVVASGSVAHGQKLVPKYFTLLFRGSIQNATTDPIHAAATTTKFQTSIDPNLGFVTTVQSLPGPLAVWDATIFDYKQNPDFSATFRENGTISFGLHDAKPHVLHVEGEGAFRPVTSTSFVGTGAWRIVSGEGQFAGATGFLSATWFGEIDPKDPTRLDTENTVTGNFFVNA
ncbi:hypothetical protein CAOG_06339 [Capsaspora owczarzaki ATCC 30864]|uniref:Lipid/polyisoprenoid-binding YceI-like domain-containing protein n=1 Tax=Capsaspora owczarzaki (strain ATCC 30864) TaxID=595528 RepID=A0A0D2ULH0_CAPO3|nr:hypothetical protein CAOG_06339 [Capsaspora owczarzaki ATCC 30864]KJE95956.1 hypothetical protein CAOG_006339 [Capsaspora owczarzaki ATCC 30864]|eukprot:XP_004345088.1 hypothetical protein CAOG_06339 [Capsaspora owczarzaki ATCC 30864]